MVLSTWALAKSFSGVWFGGMIFDITGSNNLIWQIAIGLGLGSAILHLPQIDPCTLTNLLPD